MARIGNIPTAPGVTAETDMRGNIKTFTVNVKKCSEDVLSFFTSLGFSISTPKPNARTRKVINDAASERNMLKFKSTEELFKHWEANVQD